jgi:hypothetical protein
MKYSDTQDLDIERQSSKHIVLYSKIALYYKVICLFDEIAIKYNSHLCCMIHKHASHYFPLGM